MSRQILNSTTIHQQIWLKRAEDAGYCSCAPSHSSSDPLNTLTLTKAESVLQYPFYPLNVHTHTRAQSSHTGMSMKRLPSAFFGGSVPPRMLHCREGYSREGNFSVESRVSRVSMYCALVIPSLNIHMIYISHAYTHTLCIHNTLATHINTHTHTFIKYCCIRTLMQTHTSIHVHTHA